MTSRTRRRTRGTALLLAALVLSTGACRRSDIPSIATVAFDTAAVWIHTEGDSTRLLVEIADNADRRSLGLMNRPHLDPGSGMLFVHETDQEGTRGFWMWQTLIPLDIAFMDSTGVIRRILAMEPCELRFNPGACPVYEPGVEYRTALEVNRGWFDTHGVREGDRVVVEPRAEPLGTP